MKQFFHVCSQVVRDFLWVLGGVSARQGVAAEGLSSARAKWYVAASIATRRFNASCGGTHSVVGSPTDDLEGSDDGVVYRVARDEGICSSHGVD